MDKVTQAKEKWGPAPHPQGYQEAWEVWCQEHEARAMLLGAKFNRLACMHKLGDGTHVCAQTMTPLDAEEARLRGFNMWGITLFKYHFNKLTPLGNEEGRGNG